MNARRAVGGLILAAGIGVAGSIPAHATTTPAVTVESAGTVLVDAPTQVVARTTQVTFTVRVRTTTRTIGGVYEASIYTQSPYSDYGMGMTGWGQSDTPWVPVTVTVDTAWTGWGTLPLLACDDATGECEAATTSIKRQSRAAVTHAETLGHGKVAVAVRVTHYDPARRAWVGSNRSPVRIQQYTARGWVTVADVTTNRDGLAGAVITARPGYRLFRSVRLTGETVTAAVSRPVRVRVV